MSRSAYGRGGGPQPRVLASLRAPFIALLALLAGTPFLLTTIPPLTDIPGHIGRFAVQTATPSDALLRYFGFQWTLTLNLAGDVIVQLLHPLFGLLPTVWLLCAMTPVLTVIGIGSVARVLNPRGAYALPWALLFVFNFSLLYGFLNFSLTLALALIALAGWVAMRASPHWRSALFLFITPLLLIGHGVAGIVLIVAIAGYSASIAWDDRRRGAPRTLVATLLPLWSIALASAVTLIVWKATGASDHGVTQWLLDRKFDAVMTMLRDQHPVFDIASVLCCISVWIIGRAAGARLRPGALGVVVGVVALFIVTPSMISGSNRIDTRLAPVIAMLAFALQDWSTVAPRRRRAVMLAGCVLLGARFAVTTLSFVAYDQRYRSELRAVPHIPVGSRVLNLAQVDCGLHGWRSERTEHLGNLVTPLRRAWVNAHWSVDGLQLLSIRYRPAPGYFADPSELIWPASCVDQRQRFELRERHMLVESIAQLPLAKVDYVWLIGAQLPPAARDPRLLRVWWNDRSELYRVRASASSSADDRAR